jgi:hypothetical protein
MVEYRAVSATYRAIGEFPVTGAGFKAKFDVDLSVGWISR